MPASTTPRFPAHHSRARVNGSTAEQTTLYLGRVVLDSAALTAHLWHSLRGIPPGTSGCKMRGRRQGGCASPSRRHAAVPRGCAWFSLPRAAYRFIASRWAGRFTSPGSGFRGQATARPVESAPLHHTLGKGSSLPSMPQQVESRMWTLWLNSCAIISTLLRLKISIRQNIHR